MPKRHPCDRVPCPECSPDEYLDSTPFDDSLGYPAALGYDQPDPYAGARPNSASFRFSRGLYPEPDEPDYTGPGPDLDVDAVIAAATDHTRAGAIRHDYLRAIRDGAHLQPGERYLDAGPD